MAQEAVAAVLVVDHDFEALQQTADIADDGIGTLILEQALIDRDHFVCALFINTGYDRSVFFACKGGIDFIPVMIRIFHANHAFDRDDALQSLLQELLFFRELLFVGEVQIPSATIGLGEFEVTVAADMVLTGDEVVGDENAKSYLCKPNVRIKYNGSGLVGDAFIKVFHAKIDKNELELQNKTDVLVKTAGAFSKTVVPQFKASVSDYETFKKGTPFKLYVTLQGKNAEFALTSDGKVTVSAVDKV